ncbi:MAG: hypothetical protein JOZ33_13495 [Acidobacteriaceae bacterium]|nr:hypothetical protein [Acidobacteriaceae bacterium]
MLKTVSIGLLTCALLSLVTNTAFAQAIRIAKRQPGSPYTSVSSLTVAASPSTVSFRLVSDGIATGSNAINITTTWGGSVCLFSCTINLYAYFSNASAALSGGGSPVVNIPSAEVRGQVPTGSPTAFTQFSESNPLGGAGASLLLFQQSFFLGTFGGSRTDSLSLEIDLTNQPQLPAGSYSGTLYIQAQSL